MVVNVLPDDRATRRDATEPLFAVLTGVGATNWLGDPQSNLDPIWNHDGHPLRDGWMAATASLQAATQ